jgi:hypothetical protein
MFKLFYENTFVNFIAMELKYFYGVYVCGNFISMKLNVLWYLIEFTYDPHFIYLKWLKHFVPKCKIYKYWYYA